MAISPELGERRTVETPAGTIEYRESGSGQPVVFVHGVGVNGDLWRNVAPELADDWRCIVPDLPLGGHSIPLNDEPDLSLFGGAGPRSRTFIPEDNPERLVALVREFLEE
jgi:pimeloyl-ACP methyl ester carboxylesterase